MEANRNHWDNMDDILQNLQDADCSSEIITAFMAKRDERNLAAQLHILALWRAQLLEKIHKNQRFLDRLDFLVHQLRREVCDD